MIKICDSDIVYVKYERLYKDSCLQNDYVSKLIKKKTDVDTAKFIIEKENEIVAAASLADIYNNNILYKVFRISEDVFERVRDYVHSHKMPEGVSFPVLDEEGKCLFIVMYVENVVLGDKRAEFLDYEKNFFTMEDLDFTLLNKYKTFIFVSVEEYSVAIAKLLYKRYPDKKIIFLDRRSKYFLGKLPFWYLPMCGTAEKYFDILCNWIAGGGNLSFINRLISFSIFKIVKYLKKLGGYIFITPNKRHFWPMDTIYNSGSVMYSLLWCKERKKYGHKNSDKIIYLLDYACNNEGLVSIIRWTLAHVRWIVERGGYPVINLKKFPNQYLNNENENMWEYYFEPVSEVTVEAAYESENVISLSDNDIILGEGKINPYQRKWMELPDKKEFDKIVKLNTETQIYINEHMPKEIGESRILGVVARGTDFREEAAKKINKKWRQNIVGIDEFISACCYCKDALNCEYIFLATEDAEYFERFKNSFGEKLLFVSQKRVSYNYENSEYLQVKDLLKIEDGREFGRKYLTVIRSLSQCDALLYNVSCGAVQLANVWNDGKYEMSKCIDATWISERKKNG